MPSEMREPTYLVLTALAGGRRHGYAVMQDVATISSGKVRLRAGTLYATLDRLLGEGLVEVAGEEVVDGRARRYYVLSDQGRSVLAAESRQRATIATEALRRLDLAGGVA
jgi:DNA-binding PadR family transcriptional regulator